MIKEVEYASEASLQRAIIAKMKKILPQDSTFFWKVSDRYIAGVPDIVGCTSGIPFAIEVKHKKNKPTKLQLITMDVMRRAGFLVLVTYSVQEVEQFLKEVVLEKVTDTTIDTVDTFSN